jgi:hypothetical protein
LTRPMSAEIPDFPGLFLTDDAGEVTGAKTAVERADFGTGLAEAGVIRGDGEVADDVQNVTAADGVTGDHGDDGLGQGADFFLEIEHVEAGNAVLADVTGVAADFLIAAGTEREVAGAGEDDGTDLGVLVGEIKRD